LNIREGSRWEGRENSLCDFPVSAKQPEIGLLLEGAFAFRLLRPYSCFPIPLRGQAPIFTSA